MDLPEHNTPTLSEAAKLLGVNRRTLQRWVRAGKVEQSNSGRVDYRKAVEHMMRPRVGRPTKGLVWKWPGFWKLNDTPAMIEAQPFLADKKLKALQQTLAIIAHWHANQGSVDQFVEAIEDVLKVATKARDLKNSGNVAWNVQAGRFVQSLNKTD